MTSACEFCGAMEWEVEKRSVKCKGCGVSYSRPYNIDVWTLDTWTIPGKKEQKGGAK